MQPTVCDRDEVAFVEVTDSFLKHFLADLERALDVIGRTLVAERTEAVMALDPFQERVGKVKRLTPSCGLKDDIELAIGANFLHEAFQRVTRVDILEDLITIDEALVLVIDDNLEAEVRLLPYQQVDLLLLFQSCRFSRLEIFVNLRCCYDTVTLLVEMDVDDVAFANLHLLLLLAERTEEILHQSPVEESTVLVHPGAFEASEVAYLSEGCLRCCRAVPPGQDRRSSALRRLPLCLPARISSA